MMEEDTEDTVASAEGNECLSQVNPSDSSMMEEDTEDTVASAEGNECLSQVNPSDSLEDTLKRVSDLCRRIEEVNNDSKSLEDSWKRINSLCKQIDEVNETIRFMRAHASADVNECSSQLNLPVSCIMGDASSDRSECCTQVFDFADHYCGICLKPVKNRCFINSCSHPFCLGCLLKWSKQKVECPICKQSYTNVYFCVTSSHAYRRIPLRCLIHPPDKRCSGELGFYCSQFGRIKKLLDCGNLLTHDSDKLAINKSYMKRDQYLFRRLVYANNYWALGERYIREWRGPEYYLEHPEFVVQMFPWIYRELEVLLSDDEHLIDEAFDLVVSLLHIYEIYSNKCVNYLKSFLGEQTHHFLHELIHFINSKMSMRVYDHSVVIYSSVHFLRSNEICGAVVNSPVDYQELIMLEDDKKPIISTGIKRKRMTSSFPTVTFADIVAITPDSHGLDRLYALNEIGSTYLDIKRFAVRQQSESNTAFSIRRY